MIWTVAITTWSEMWQSQHNLNCGNHNMIWNVAITTWSELWQLHHEFYFSIITLYHVGNSVNLLTFILCRLANLGVTCNHACNRLPLKSHEQVLQEQEQRQTQTNDHNHRFVVTCITQMTFIHKIIHFPLARQKSVAKRFRNSYYANWHPSHLEFDACGHHDGSEWEWVWTDGRDHNRRHGWVDHGCPCSHRVRRAACRCGDDQTCIIRFFMLYGGINLFHNLSIFFTTVKI